MRTLSVLALLFALPIFADEPKPAKPNLKPIALVDLKRTDALSFEKDVLPIFAKKCHACHAGKVTEGKLDLSTYAAMMKGGANGAVLVAGKASESYLFQLAGHIRKPIMPPKSDGDPMTSEEVSALKLWIDQGAKPPAVDSKIKRVVVLSLPPALVKPVRALAIHPDQSLVASGRGNQIHLYDGKTGDFKKTLVDPELKLPDGKPANSAHISLVESMAFSPDGKTLATGSFQEVTLWDMEKGMPRVRLSGFADRVVALAYSPDGKMLATGGGAATEDGEIKFFDGAGKLLGEVKNGHSDTVFGVAFSPDGKLLAAGAADKFVKVFEVPTGKFVKSFEGHTNHVLDVGWTADGKRIVSCGADGDKMVKIWDFEKGVKVRDLTTGKLQATRLIFIPKSPNFLTCSGDGAAKIWTADGGQGKDFPGAKDYLYAVAVSPDGKLVAHGGEEGIARLYNGETGALVKALYPPGAEPKVEVKPMLKK